MSRAEGRRLCLYDTAELDAVLDRMAQQAAGLLTGRTQATLVGILRRGAPIADMLGARLDRDFGIPRLPRLNLAIKRYDDDLSLRHSETPLTEAPEHATLDLTGQTILLVDDVIYEGHSMLRAIDYLARRNPAEIRTVVLVDRDVARLPVRTDVVGARLDVAPGDIIECNVPPYELQFRIDLCRQER